MIGMGYVGLCTAAAFASKGIRTIGIDIDEKRIELIQQGRAPLYEPHLDGLLKKAVKKRLLTATNDISQATRHLLNLSNRRNSQPERRLHRHPEFLKEGTAINDTLHPDKIVIGANDKKSANTLKQLYRRFYGKNLPQLILTSPDCRTC